MADEPIRILVVGDDQDMVGLLSAALRLANYEVRTAGTGHDAVTAAEEWEPHVVAQDGFQVTRNVRARRTVVPAVFLTPGDQFENKLPGLTVGGGDYLTKPFSPGDLVARVRAVLRRTCAHPDTPSDPALQCADLELVEDTYEVQRAGQAIPLSPTEFKLLRYLICNAGKAVTREQILEHVWPYDYTGGDDVVETYMYKLRRKVDLREPALIPDPPSHCV